MKGAKTMMKVLGIVVAILILSIDGSVQAADKVRSFTEKMSTAEGGARKYRGPSPSYDALAKEFLTTLDEASRLRLAKEIQLDFTSNMYMVPLVIPKAYAVAGSHVRNFTYYDTPTQGAEMWETVLAG